jgi:hypothetical protein
MVAGKYRRVAMADLQDFGWSGKPSRQYIGVLWGWFSKGEPVTCATSMAIALPYEHEGRRYNETCQFQNVFRLLNDDELIEGPLNYALWIKRTQEIIRAGCINFFVRFDKSKSGALMVKEITLCQRDTITDRERFKWPESYLGRIAAAKEEEIPTPLVTRKFYKSKDWQKAPASKKVVLENPIPVDDVSLNDMMEEAC